MRKRRETTPHARLSPELWESTTGSVFGGSFMLQSHLALLSRFPPLTVRGRCGSFPHFTASRAAADGETLLPWSLCHTAGPTRSSLRLKLFPQSKMVWPGDNLGEVDDQIETLEFKTNVATLPKNEVGDLGSYKSTGSRLLVSTYSVHTLG